MANFTPQEIEEMLQEFFDTVGKRQYTGARYVPIFGRRGSDTCDWDNSDAYEPLTIVIYQGNSYTSKQYVPKGVNITDTNYWVQTGNWNAQIEQYRQEVLQFQNKIDEKIPWPITPESKYGNAGQVLGTLLNGLTKWVDPVTVTSEIAEPLIEAWLSEHPEATTTVQDGSITYAKLNSNLLDRLLHASDTFQQASNHSINDANDQPNNSVTFISWNITEAAISNLPAYGLFGILFKVNFSYQTNGFLQFYGNVNELYYREEHQTGGQAVYGTWHRIYPLETNAVNYDNLSENLAKRLLHASSDFQQASSHTLNDANDQPNNSVTFIAQNITSALIPNLPKYGSYGILFKINFSDNANGFLQFYGSANELYYREEHLQSGSSVYGSWHQIYPLVKTDAIFGSGNFNISASNIADWPFSDANDQNKNSVYYIHSDVVESDFSNLPIYGVGGLLLKINYSSTSNAGCVQIFVTPQNTIYTRTIFGSVREWSKIYPIDAVTNQHTCNIFRKVVCCGDSYTAGYIKDTSAPATLANEDYAWPHYMETITGNTYVNCGDSGATTLSWLTDERGLPKAQTAGVSQAYIIGLMINDVDRNVPLGSITNIEDANPTTYYAGLGKIVRSLNAISPYAHIFIQTCPRENASYQPYNQAVRDVAEYYANTLHTHVLDLYAYRDMYNNASLTGDSVNGHYTAIGYQQFAEILSHIFSDYINAHISSFQHVYALPFD